MTKLYGIACHGGPTHRALKVGRTSYPEDLCGSAYWVPAENKYILAPIYPFTTRKSAQEDLKRARERRCQMFLPYDGYGTCCIVKAPQPPST